MPEISEWLRVQRQKWRTTDTLEDLVAMRERAEMHRKSGRDGSGEIVRELDAALTYRLDRVWSREGPDA